MHVIEQAVEVAAVVLVVIAGRAAFLYFKPYRPCRWCRPGGLLGGSLPARLAGVEPKRRRAPLLAVPGQEAHAAVGSIPRPQGQAVADPGMGREGVGLMSCPGLHCACCSGGAAVPVVPLVAFCGLAWVAEHIVEVAIVSATCGALAVAASIALFRWAGRRDDRRLAAWRLSQAREVPVIGTRVPDSVTSAERPALGFRDLHIHLDGVPARPSRSR